MDNSDFLHRNAALGAATLQWDRDGLIGEAMARIAAVATEAGADALAAAVSNPKDSSCSKDAKHSFGYVAVHVALPYLRPHLYNGMETLPVVKDFLMVVYGTPAALIFAGCQYGAMLTFRDPMQKVALPVRRDESQTQRVENCAAFATFFRRAHAALLETEDPEDDMGLEFTAIGLFTGMEYVSFTVSLNRLECSCLSASYKATHPRIGREAAANTYHKQKADAADKTKLLQDLGLVCIWQHASGPAVSFVNKLAIKLMENFESRIDEDAFRSVAGKAANRTKHAYTEFITDTTRTDKKSLDGVRHAGVPYKQHFLVKNTRTGEIVKDYCWVSPEAAPEAGAGD